MKRDPSPSQFGAVPQTILEPILKRAVEERGGTVHFGCELLSFEDTGDEVHAKIRDGNGKECRVTADYLVAADGGRSTVRHQLGIQATLTPAAMHFLNIYFHADLTKQTEGKTFSQAQVDNERVHGLFLSQNNATLWSFHLEYDPATEQPLDYTDAQLKERLVAAIGTSDVPIELLAKPSTWSTAVRVAERYRAGRAFLVGDAAHHWPPWGGFGANTGIADAQNLTWKLARTLSGKAQPSLLDTYETERRPVALRCGEQALLRQEFSARFGIETADNKADIDRQLDLNGCMLRYQYAPHVTAEQFTQHVERMQAQVGSRFPHAWVTREGRRRSTLDLFNNTRYVAVCGPAGRAASERWQGVADAVLVVGEDFQMAEGELGWTELTGGLLAEGAVLVRPDGFVAERSDEPSQMHQWRA